MRGELTRTSARIRAQARALADFPAPRLELSSLVDVAFLLLTFFILTATLDPKEADLRFKVAPIPGVISKPLSDVIPEVTDIVIGGDGIIFCDGEVIDAGSKGRKLPALFEKLKEIKSANEMIRKGSEYVVSVKAADEVEGQRFIDVMNCLAEAGIAEVKLEGFLD